MAAIVAVGCGCGVAVFASAPVAGADPVRSAQWQLPFLHAAQAQRISTGAGVVVAVIDSGVDPHPDLAGSVLPGVNLRPGGSARRDVDGHGTAMAGLIAAHGDSVHALGLAPGARILPVRADLDEHTAAQGIVWAASHGARVINVSLGLSDVPELARAVRFAQSRDVVVVASAGNVPLDVIVQCPAAYPGVIAVSGVDRTGGFSDKSVSGPQVALAAPSVGVVSTSHDGLYSRGVGTSDAAALVSATAALVRAKFPTMDAANVVNRLIRTADDRGPPGRDPQYGFGIVDPVRALTAKVPLVSANPLLAAAPTAPASPSAAAGAPAPPAGGSSSPSASSAVSMALFGLAGLVLVGGVALLVVLVVRRRPAAVAGPPPPPWPPPRGPSEVE